MGGAPISPISKTRIKFLNPSSRLVEGQTRPFRAGSSSSDPTARSCLRKFGLLPMPIALLLIVCNRFAFGQICAPFLVTPFFSCNYDCISSVLPLLSFFGSFCALCCSVDHLLILPWSAAIPTSSPLITPNSVVNLLAARKRKTPVLEIQASSTHYKSSTYELFPPLPLLITPGQTRSARLLVATRAEK
jgi:hypothetical protein